MFFLQFLISFSLKRNEVLWFGDKDTVAQRLGDLPVGVWLVSGGAEVFPRSVSSRVQALSLHVMPSYSPGKFW